MSLFSWLLRRSKPKKYSKLDSILEIPREVASSDIKMTINGFDEILIENYKNILEYQDVLIKINTFDGAITIYGPLRMRYRQIIAFLKALVNNMK